MLVFLWEREVFMKINKALREHMQPFFKINKTLFWADFLISLSLFYLSYAVSVIYWGQPLGIVSIIVVALTLYRVGSLLHDLSHHSSKFKNLIRLYEWTFGYVVGLTYLSYTTHSSHHGIKTYGTNDDPEYSIVIQDLKKGVLISLATGVVAPLFLTVRYSIVALLMPFLPRSFQKVIFKYVSFQGFNHNFKRKWVKEEEVSQMAWREFPAGIMRTSVIVLIFLNMIPVSILYVYFISVSMAMALNMFRAVLAHHYGSENLSLDFSGQVQDSVNIEGGILMELFAPAGLQYHALHHLFGNIPGHNLRAAHKKMKELNYDWYNSVTYISLKTAIMKRASQKIVQEKEIKEAS